MAARRAPRPSLRYRGREGVDQFKSAHAIETTDRTLTEVLEGADIFLGLSVAGALSQDMVKAMADQPIIFAMANPDPEITPPDAKAVRPDAIVATGRSDYPNQAGAPQPAPRREQRDRFQHVGLARAVIADQQVEPRRPLDRGGAVVAEIGQEQAIKRHGLRALP